MGRTQESPDGAIRFDEAAGTAERGERIGALVPFLDLAWSHDGGPPER
jgi:hypothetical protein